MIPSDHFVRYYNEVFKYLDSLGPEPLKAYWRFLGDQQTAALGPDFQEGGLAAAHAYWQTILEEENCQGALTLTDDYFEFQMDCCPSLSKIRDNDAAPFERYCDHCMAWIEPLAKACGLHPVMDMHARDEPHCCFRLYNDGDKAREFESTAKLPSHPYEDLCRDTSL